jgi:hypothetical protein
MKKNEGIIVFVLLGMAILGCSVLIPGTETVSKEPRILETSTVTLLPTEAEPTETEMPKTATITSTATEPPPTKTEEPTWTVTMTPTEVEPVTGDMLYTTDFSDIEEWTVIENYEDLDGYIVEKQGDHLFLRIPGVDDGIWVYYEERREWTDVRVEVDTELVGGTNYTYIAIMCRSTEEGEYIFYLDTGGYWQIGKWMDDFTEYEQLAYGGSSVINLAKAKNHIEIECEDEKLVMYINGEEVGRAIDDEFSHGRIGVGVETFDNPIAEVKFSNLEVIMP